MKWEDCNLAYMGDVPYNLRECQRCRTADSVKHFIVWHTPKNAIVKFYCEDCFNIVFTKRYPEGLPQELI